jgi:hypothetical protein
MSTSRSKEAAAQRIVTIPPNFPARLAWWVLFGIALSLLALFFVSLGMVFGHGTGVWGNNIPVAWGFPISNYIWWLGIGHAGTLISAMLLLLGQQWRNTLNRFAEAMTLFAVMCAGLYPIIHLGRPWRFYWMAPYFNSMQVWPQFKSPLTWDFFAVLTYLTVSVLFWYIGIIPDLAAARDRGAARRLGPFGDFAPDGRRPRPRLDLDRLPALFRSRRGLFRLRGGVNAQRVVAGDAAPRRARHSLASRHARRSDARDGHDDRLRLFQRGVHRSLCRRLRGGDDVGPLRRPLCANLLGGGNP